MKFIKLTLDNGNQDVIYLNPEHIIALEDYEHNTYITTLAASKGNFSVQESSEDILAMISGEKTTPKKHTENGATAKSETPAKKAVKS